MQLKGKKTKLKRESGILLALSSLPSPEGIGTLGKEAYEFADFLKSANQTYWQLLPLVPIGKSNSPYCSTGAFAGEILYIDLQMLFDEGFISNELHLENNFSSRINYDSVKEFKIPILKKAVESFDKESKEFKRFKAENFYWLKDYALFMAITDSKNNQSFVNWEDGLKYRLPDALKKFEEENQNLIDFYEITQFFFYKQFFKFKDYTKAIGLKLIGDIPFYVSFNSADVWANPDCFKLGRDMTPVLVSGVPPDLFSSDGQLWGNPIYDWDYQKKYNYHWWKNRLKHNALLYDTIRIDHFRAFADYYTIPYGSKTAKNGKWERGVGIDFFNNVKSAIGNSSIIAEDLGEETPEVFKLVKDTGFPNMKVLQFAFDSDLKDPFLPKNFNKNCVCYTGTHDNDTTLGWLKSASKKELILFNRLVEKDKSGSDVLSLIAFGMKSKAATVIIPMQDYLELDSSCRTNTPGTVKGNWEWRFKKEDINEELIKTIKRLSKSRN